MILYSYFDIIIIIITILDRTRQQIQFDSM